MLERPQIVQSSELVACVHVTESGPDGSADRMELNQPLASS